MKKIKEKHGFTIVEMLVVISIITILMTLSLLGADKVRQRSRDAKRKSDLAKAQGILTLYYSDKKTYPLPCLSQYPGGLPCYFDGTLGGYDLMMNGNHLDTADPAYFGGLKGDGYADVEVQDEKFDASQSASDNEFAYRYRVSEDGLDFELSAKLENANDNDLTKDATGNGSDPNRYERGTDKAIITGNCNSSCPSVDLYDQPDGANYNYLVPLGVSAGEAWKYGFDYPDGNAPSPIPNIHMQ